MISPVLLAFIPVLVLQCHSMPNDEYSGRHTDTDGPITHVINTPYGPQVITQHTRPDGTFFYTSSGPGFHHTSFSSGNIPGVQYSSMSHGAGNQGSYLGTTGNGIYQGSYQGMGMGGNGMFMGSGMAPMGGIPSMPSIVPMPKFEWWPSIFDTHKKDHRK